MSRVHDKLHSQKWLDLMVQSRFVDNERQKIEGYLIEHKFQNIQHCL